jgi:hypothetical protein
MTTSTLFRSILKNLNNLAKTSAKAAVLILPLLTLQGRSEAQTSSSTNLATVERDGDYLLLRFAKSSKDQATVEEFVAIGEEVTGITFVFTEEMQIAMGQKKLMGFGSKRMHKDDFYGFFQIQLFINDFICQEVGPAHLGVVQIRSLSPSRGRQATSVKQSATRVAASDVQKYADQSATLITTVIDLPNLDSRSLSQSLRGMLVDKATQSIIPAGAHSLIITGFGSNVASLVKLLSAVNKSATPSVVESKPAKQSDTGAAKKVDTDEAHLCCCKK